MGQISVSLPTDGETIDASDYNTPITTIVNEINGELDNSNIAPDAAIAGSKLANGAVDTDQLANEATTPAKWTNPYHFKAIRSGGSFTSASGSVKTVFPYDAESYDTNSNYNTSNYRYTAPVDGIYHVDASFGIGSASTGSITIHLYKNSAVNTTGDQITSASPATDRVLKINTDIQLSATDTIEVRYETQNAITLVSIVEATYFNAHLIHQIQ